MSTSRQHQLTADDLKMNISVVPVTCFEALVLISGSFIAQETDGEKLKLVFH
jgi:hypothetical protein